MPKLLAELICKGYTISICFVAYFTRLYVLIIISHKQLNLQKKLIHFIPLGLDIILSLILPIYMYLGDGQIYTYGVVIYITYITVSIYLLSSIYHVIRYKNLIDRLHFYAISFLLSAWIVTALIQFLKSEWLLVGFAMAAAMVFMLFCLENPTQNIDNLTGLFNQSAYYSYLNNLCYENKDFILILLTLEDMRFINETFGIKNADIFLKKIANYLNLTFIGKAFRDHGNRFALIFNKDLDKIPETIKAIQTRFSQPWEIANLEYTATVCMVEIRSSLCGMLPEKMIEFGRYYTTKAKQSGKGCYLRITKKHIAEREQNGIIEKMLKRAIKNKQIQVYYQPIYSIKENKYISAEALTRLTDENGNFISPDLFIRAAEQNGMILELGMLIFEEVCKFINSNSLKEQGLDYIEINLSVVQCMQEKLADELLEVMTRYHIPPDFINLEITETAAINSDYNLKKNMDKLIAKGVSFSLDDYGTGYSNLSYMLDFPVKLVKIDKSIAQACCNTEKVQIAMESIILMTKKLNLKVVAEGIETKEQLVKMGQLDIDFIQGYYFSRPLEKSSFLKELNRKNKEDMQS